MPPKKVKQVEAITHQEASRKNIPTAEQQPVMEEDDQATTSGGGQQIDPFSDFNGLPGDEAMKVFRV